MAHVTVSSTHNRWPWRFHSAKSTKWRTAPIKTSLSFLCHLMRHFQWNSWKCMCVCVSVQLLHSQTVTGMCLCKSLSESVGWIPDCVCVCVSSSQPHESKLSYICSINPSCSLAYDLALISISIKMEMQHHQHWTQTGRPCTHFVSVSLSNTHTLIYHTYLSRGCSGNLLEDAKVDDVC